MKNGTILLPYGNSNIAIEILTDNPLEILKPRDFRPGLPESVLLDLALQHPIGSPPLHEMALGGKKVAIITSDISRPCPSEKMLPSILDELNRAGVPDKDIQIVIALGLHRPMSEKEREKAVGEEVCRRVNILNHNIEDTIYIGTTSFGTPVEIFRVVAEADFRICLGNLELHYFAGYSGGAKAIVPGCASRQTITHNHTMMTHPAARACNLEGNPIRADLEEAASFVGIDFILNVVVDSQHQITAAYAGDSHQAHRLGCQKVLERSTTPIQHLADLVIVSAGGFPKDINLYQAHKALENAVSAVKQNGILIFVAECREGFGQSTFEAWMPAFESPDAILEEINRHFVLGGHKAAAIANILKRARIFIVSAMDQDTMRKCHMVPYGDCQLAVKDALADLGPHAEIFVMPNGGSTMPFISGKG